MHQDRQEPTIDHPLLRIIELEQELCTADQDAPWRLMPWARDVTTVESLDTLPTNVQTQNKKKGLALNVNQKII